MKEGTKSVLFGAHSVIHSIYVTLAWMECYKKWPSFKEIVCIFLHDIGYWGMDYLTNKTNDGHAELGARIAHKLFGGKYWLLVAGHSSAAQKKFNIPASKLELPDEYSWLISPVLWMRWNAWIEGFKIGPEKWKELIREHLESGSRESTTSLLNRHSH